MTQPPPLNFQPSNDPDWSPKSRFLAALIIGSVASAIAWSLLWKFQDQGGFGIYAVVLIPSIKIVLAIVGLFFPQWRSASGGLFASIGIGFLIFFGLCTMSIMHA